MKLWIVPAVCVWCVAWRALSLAWRVFVSEMRLHLTATGAGGLPRDHLARQVLAELPSQLTAFMGARGIRPGATHTDGTAPAPPPPPGAATVTTY